MAWASLGTVPEFHDSQAFSLLLVRLSLHSHAEQCVAKQSIAPREDIRTVDIFLRLGKRFLVFDELEPLSMRSDRFQRASL